jgi:predicted metal-dependent phosphoesterase TrpH
MVTSRGFAASTPWNPPDRIMRAAKQRDLRGIIITDHDMVKGELVVHNEVARE